MPIEPQTPEVEIPVAVPAERDPAQPAPDEPRKPRDLGDDDDDADAE